MKFSKIGMTKDLDVTLKRKDEHTHSKDAIETTGVNPLPEFRDAVQAFLPHFLTLVPSLKEEKKNLRVSTLSLGEKDGKRSLQVSVSLAVEACGGAVISMTTPRMAEEPANIEGDEDDESEVTYLSKPLLKLIDRVEMEASRYVNGETAQTDAFQQASENSKAVDKKMAEAEVSSTRKPRHTKSPVAGSIPASPIVQ
jgi:hypothetical protein